MTSLFTLYLVMLYHCDLEPRSVIVEVVNGIWTTRRISDWNEAVTLPQPLELISAEYIARASWATWIQMTNQMSTSGREIVALKVHFGGKDCGTRWLFAGCVLYESDGWLKRIGGSRFKEE